MWTHGHFYWNELMTRDVEKAKRFYAETLGWSFERMPMGGENAGRDYWVIMDGMTPVGGIFSMDDPMFQGMPEHWFAYIAVDDVAARVEKAKAAGAKIAREPFHVPGVGRIATIEQPGGAAVGWMTPEQPGG